MKKTILLFVFVITSFNFCLSQEWFTSFDAAKKFALVHDKMLFVMWEDSFNYPYYVIVENDKGNSAIFDLTLDDSLDSFIWKYFIPVKLNEANFAELSNQIMETRGANYFNKLEDDSIKIMDVNGNILNIKSSGIDYDNLTLIVKKYALNTSYFKQELNNYSEMPNFTTAFSLATKYIDFSIFAESAVRNEIIELANIYLEEAKNFLLKSDLENKSAFMQKCELLILKEYLILDNPRKVLRLLRKLDVLEIEDINRSLFAFLNYTAYKLLKDEENAIQWESEISLVDLKKAELIININR